VASATHPLSLYPLQILVTVSFHSSLFFVILFISVQLRLIASCSLVMLLHQLLRGLPLFLFPTSRCSSACLTMLSFAFFNICPIQFHFLHFTVVSMGSCFVMFHNSMLLILSSQCVFSIFLSDLFMKVCNFCQLFLSTIQVSAP
jgi:hypothetical protein